MSTTGVPIKSISLILLFSLSKVGAWREDGLGSVLFGVFPFYHLFLTLFPVSRASGLPPWSGREHGPPLLHRTVGRCCSPCLFRLLLSGCVLRGAVEAGAASGTRVSAAALGATAALPLRVLRVVLSARSHLPGPPPHGNRLRSSLGASLASERLSRARGALGAPAATSSRGVAVCAHRHLSLRRGRSYFCRGRFSSAPVLTRPQIYFRLLPHFISAPVTNSIITINFIFFKGE